MRFNKYGLKVAPTIFEFKKINSPRLADRRRIHLPFTIALVTFAIWHTRTLAENFIKKYKNQNFRDGSSKITNKNLNDILKVQPMWVLDYC